MNSSTEKQNKTGIFFEIEYMFATVKGKFVKYDSRINFDENSLVSSSVQVNVQTASVDINSFVMEELVKSKDFFNSEEHPEMIFRLNTIEKVKKNYNAKGSIEIKGLNMSFEIPFKIDKTKKGKKTLKSTFVIDRTNYKIGDAVFMLGKEVKIKLRVPL